MERRGSSSAVLLILAGLCGSVCGQQNCKSCYQMGMGAIIGIVTGDIILTVLIALSVFCFATRINESRLEALKGTSDIKMKGKVSANTESTYQELQRHKQDIYSDLRQCS
ncbi:TYRO protein tyrosine kinase-binding protein [Polyodon spathula]|uniref:TYRO protein tyrosine kinase-binding protein n=1 Tax=Polyodon spathula TaxID=7913 RepID=UPI001B7DCE47|nr:TYRO protein tyrosine kinase-binding protein [Polyodon spathula]